MIEIIEKIVPLVVSMLLALGGFEFIKWAFARKTDKRVLEASADSSEFSVLKETTIFLQEQLKLKEERFAEQTQVVRKLTTDNLELTREVAMLKTERGLKLCERRNCVQREPQSGY